MSDVSVLSAASQEAKSPDDQVRSAQVKFGDNARDFHTLVVQGAGLELVTAGFYRFWLATDVRRHLWSHTSVEGDALEYTGAARELLIGFLVALAILVPIYLVYFLLGIEAERLQAFASFPLVIFLYGFFQFALYRARRYRTSRTIWRGVRFWMTGSGWAYALRSLLWGLFAVVTLGIAYPWREAALERYKMRNTHYGNLQGRFEGTGWGLFKQVWWIGFLIVAAVCSLFLTPVVVVIAWPRANPAVVVLAALAPIVSFPFLYPLYKATSWRWWVSGARIGDVRFESYLPTGALMGKYWAVAGWGVLVLFIDGLLVAGLGGAVWAIIRFAGQDAGNAPLALFLNEHVYALYVLSILNYLVIALVINIFLRIYLVRGVWERIAATTIVHRLETADNVVAMGGSANALGEGFANDLDIGGF